MSIDATHYTYRVRWSEGDGEFLATVAEFPSLSWLDGDNVRAYEGVVGLVAGVVADMEAAGEDVPRPLASRGVSGSTRQQILPGDIASGPDSLVSDMSMASGSIVRVYSGDDPPEGS